MSKVDLNAKMNFMKNNWCLELSKIPKYVDFQEDFTQPLDYHLCKLLMESNDKNLTPEMKTDFNNQIINNINKNTGVLKVLHNNTKYKIGRFYGNKNFSIIPQSKYLKHTLFSYLGWLDLDMIKGHATIASTMGDAIGLDFKHIKYYTNNFDAIADEFIEYYSSEIEGDEPLDKNDIKKFFNLMIYGGGFSTWKEKLAKGNPKKNVKPKKIQNEDIMHPIAVNYKAQCDDIAKKIYSANPSLVRKLTEPEDTKDTLIGKVTSYWFQIIENHIIYICYQLLVQKRVIEKRVCGLEYDGLCIPPTPFKINKDEFIVEINDKILHSTGLAVKMKFKDYDPDYVLSDIIEQRKNMIIPIYDEPVDEVEEVVDIKKNNSREVFEKKYPEFEKSHCKILHTGSYVTVTNNNTCLVRTDKKFRDSYKHMQCGYQDGRKQAFIDVWMNCNDKIRNFDFMNIYPNASLCPKNAFNLWRPFAMELYTKPYIENTEAVNFILNHIRILCDNDENVYQFFIKWIAQMIQYPDVKTYIITLISEEGAGKGTLMKLFAKMLGKKKILETSTPSRDVWGSYNGLMGDYFLINLNELSKSETKGSEGQFKQLVTDGNLTLNPKGVSQYEINSYHRFIITTNKEDPITTKKDDRRNVIIRSSDEKIGDKDYFNELNDYLDDDAIIKCVYEYFKSIPKMDSFGSLPIPVTEYHSNLKEGSRDILDVWLEEFTYKNRHLIEVEKSPTEIFNDFSIWKDANDHIYEINKQKFGVRLNIIAKGNISKGKHTEYGDNRKIDIVKLKLKYNIPVNNCMINADDFNTDNDSVSDIED
jgi:hypothetical protein